MSRLRANLSPKVCTVCGNLAFWWGSRCPAGEDTDLVARARANTLPEVRRELPSGEPVQDLNASVRGLVQRIEGLPEEHPFAQRARSDLAELRQWWAGLDDGKRQIVLPLGWHCAWCRPLVWPRQKACTFTPEETLAYWDEALGDGWEPERPEGPAILAMEMRRRLAARARGEEPPRRGMVPGAEGEVSNRASSDQPARGYKPRPGHWGRTTTRQRRYA